MDGLCSAVGGVLPVADWHLARSNGIAFLANSWHRIFKINLSLEFLCKAHTRSGWATKEMQTHAFNEANRDGH